MKPKPVHVARCGAVTVKVHRNGPARFAIAWREFAGAPRTRERFKDRAAAIARADEIAKAIADGQAESVKLTGVDREAYRHAVLVLGGIPLATAVDEYVAARQLLPPGETLLGVVKAHTRALLERTAPDLPPASELVERLLHALQTHPHRPRSKARIRELRHRLTRFAAVFPALHTPNRADIERYLLELGGATKTHDNHLGAIVQLYHFARQHGWPSERPNPAAGIVRYYEPGEPVTFTPAVLRLVMAAVGHDWIPFFAIGAFAGLRPTEVFRLRWENFRWAEKVIAVPAAVAAKVRRPRLVPIAENLEQWLLPWRDKLGPLYTGASIKVMQNAQGREIARLTEKIDGLQWHNDVLRHSFGSYRLAQSQNIAQVVLEMGTSEAMLKRHYNNPKTAVEAGEWFAIAPDGDRKVVPMGLPKTANGGKRGQK